MQSMEFVIKIGGRPITENPSSSRQVQVRRLPNYQLLFVYSFCSLIHIGQGNYEMCLFIGCHMLLVCGTWYDTLRYDRMKHGQ